ncbi:hypothetical protein HDU83_003987 [Entophlyctis luteolus]|nr:hypothetical protein HDU83_003987 [Entophlyctis luteolus]
MFVTTSARQTSRDLGRVSPIPHSVSFPTEFGDCTSSATALAPGGKRTPKLPKSPANNSNFFPDSQPLESEPGVPFTVAGEKLSISGCPFVPSVSSSPLESPPLLIESTHKSAEAVNAQHHDSLRNEYSIIEESIKKSQQEVVMKVYEAFRTQRNEIEISQLQKYQQNEIRYAKAAYEKYISLKQMSRQHKALNRMFAMESKIRDMKILHHGANSGLYAQMQQVLHENREELESTLLHTEKVHLRKCRNLIHNQDLRNKTDLAIFQMELRFYSPESRTKLTKRYVVKQNHQYIVDKKELDQLKELQTRELKHIKEYFDQRLFCTDEIFKLKSQQQDLVHQLAIKHFKELKEEKESLFHLKEESKVKQYDDLHQNQLRKILDRHRMQTENMIASHEQKNLTVDQSSEHYTKLLFSNIMNWSETNLTANSVCGSSHISLGSTVRNSLMDEARRSVASDTQSIGYTISEVRSSSDPIRVARERIKFLKDRQREIKATQVHDHLEELEQLQRHHQQKIAELKQQHEVEVFKLQKAHEKEIMELQIVHNREIEMEQSIHDAEEETLTERRILGSVLDSVVDGIIIIDTNAIVRRINFACENIFGYTSEEIVGQNVKILMPEYIAAKHDEIIANYLRTGVKSVIGVGRKLKGKRKNGELFSIHLSVTEVKQEEQHLFTGVIRDITNESIQEEMFEAQCKRDEELQVITLAAEKRRADEAEQSRKQQERYIDMVSVMRFLPASNVNCLEKKHTVIDERLQKMLDSAKEATTLIGLCAKHQKTIADDVLSMSKLNMNLIQISDSTPFDPTDIVQSSIETFRNDALKRGIEMSLETKNNLSQLLGEYPKLFGDPARLLQVLVQLISNAIKFTEKSEKKKVTIIADCIGSENGFVFLEFSVIDTGIGMTEEEQGLLFKQFSQESYKTYAEYGGSGLGLFIAKELTTLMVSVKLSI